MYKSKLYAKFTFSSISDVFEMNKIGKAKEKIQS